MRGASKTQAAPVIEGAIEGAQLSIEGAQPSGRARTRVVLGDWQTPLDLAKQVVALIERSGREVAAILEPTCGEGSFLEAALIAFPSARALGFDISGTHVRVASARLARRGEGNARVEVGDFFQLSWEKIVESLPEPILVLGNPPWVTNSALGTLGAENLPVKRNVQGRRGLDALTGKSNFDISEWMVTRLLEALGDRRFTLMMLCKASVARKVMEHVAARGWNLPGEVRPVDARTHFGAAVGAVLLRVESARSESARASTVRVPRDVIAPAARDLRWAVYPSLASKRPERFMGVIDGKSCPDLRAYRATSYLEGRSRIEWRSGIKHDCAKVMELEIGERGLVNGFGELVRIEPDYLFPLLKGSDLAHGRQAPRRRLLVTQRSLGEDTSPIRKAAPATWRYLNGHRGAFEARKSRIYRGRPPFALFGVGDYSFAPYKVAICGLYKRFTFTLLHPIEGRPVMVDDTAYFLPCSTEAEALALLRALEGRLAREFFEARVFWDAKRPISKSLLRSLSLEALLRAENAEPISEVSKGTCEAGAGAGAAYI